MPEKRIPISMYEALRIKAAGRTQFENLQTHRDDALLKIEKDTVPTIKLRQTASLVAAALRFNRNEKFRAKLEEAQEKHKGVLKDITEAHPAVRGVILKPFRRAVNVIPSTTIAFDEPALRAATGDAYSSVIREHITVSALIPIDQIPPTELDGMVSDRTPEQRVKLAFRLGFLGVGFDPENLPDLKTDVVTTVDQPMLFELVENGQVPDIETVGEAYQTLAVKSVEYNGRDV